MVPGPAVHGGKRLERMRTRSRRGAGTRKFQTPVSTKRRGADGGRKANRIRSTTPERDIPVVSRALTPGGSKGFLGRKFFVADPRWIPLPRLIFYTYTSRRHSCQYVRIHTSGSP